MPLLTKTVCKVRVRSSVHRDGHRPKKCFELWFRGARHSFRCEVTDNASDLGAYALGTFLPCGNKMRSYYAPTVFYSAIISTLWSKRWVQFCGSSHGQLSFEPTCSSWEPPEPPLAESARPTLVQREPSNRYSSFCFFSYHIMSYIMSQSYPFMMSTNKQSIRHLPPAEQKSSSSRLNCLLITIPREQAAGKVLILSVWLLEPPFLILSYHNPLRLCSLIIVYSEPS